MKYLYLLLTLPAILLFASCKDDGPKDFPSPETSLNSRVDTINNYNIVIVEDLSNRLTTNRKNKVVPDAAIVASVLKNVNVILKHRRQTNQKDRIQVVPTNKPLLSKLNINLAALKLDFSTFTNQKDRINYITGVNKEEFLSQDVARFNAEFEKMIAGAAAETGGADIWSFFKNGFDQNLLATQKKALEYNGSHFYERYLNYVIVLTDGYIEAGTYGAESCEGNQCRDLSSSRIEKFRNAYNAQKVPKQPLPQFFQEGGYGILPVSNPLLRDCSVLVMEIDDRSLTPSGNSTKNPSDYEVIKLFWSDWLQKSGIAGKVEITQTARSAAEAEATIMRFLGI